MCLQNNWNLRQNKQSLRTKQTISSFRDDDFSSFQLIVTICCNSFIKNCCTKSKNKIKWKCSMHSRIFVIRYFVIVVKIRSRYWFSIAKVCFTTSNNEKIEIIVFFANLLTKFHQNSKNKINFHHVFSTKRVKISRCWSSLFATTNKNVVSHN